MDLFGLETPNDLTWRTAWIRFFSAAADDIHIPSYNSGVADRLALYQATSGTTHSAKVLVLFKDGSHSIFTDHLVPAAWL